MQGENVTSRSIQPQKLSFEESLQKEVFLRDLCAGCGACVLVCPFSCLDYFEENPKLVKKCEICGICPKVCPRYEMSQPRLERLVFGRERNPKEEFGVYRRLAVAQASDQTMLQSCQDGGVVSALLTFALKNSIIDGAIVSATSTEKPWFPIPKLVSTPEEILECAGTRYSYSPNILALQEAVKQRKKSIAFVGTPCQVQAVRKIEAVPLKKYSSLIRFTVGLMCTESFSYKGLMETHVRETLGVNINDVQKMNIKGKILVTTKSGEVKTITLTEAKKYTRKGCVPCTDFSSELADISTGGLGLNGWTFTIMRSQKGQEIFEAVEKTGIIKTRHVDEEKAAMDLLVKLSARKRKTI